ncbi:MAG: hypothetical protein ABI134_13085, partial [Byssovorax sp.]
RVELTRLVTTTPPPPLAPRVPGGVLPPALEALVTCLLRKEAQARFNSARDVVTAIDALMLPAPASARAIRSDQATVAPRARPAGDASRQGSTPTIAAGRGSLASLASSRASLASSPRASMVISDGPVDQMMATLPGPLRGVPAQALFSWLGLLGILGVVILAISLRSPKSIAALENIAAASGTSASRAHPASAAPDDDDEPPPAPPTASSADLDAARAGGLVELGPLAQRFPSDVAVLKALMLAHASDKAGYSAAIGVARRLLDVAPATTMDADVRRVLLLGANGPPDVAAQAFDLLAARMGSAGPDLLFELVTTSSTAKLPKERAAKQLDDPAVRALASPALLVALELRAALPCGRKPLLARARESGDARSLGYLKPMLPTTGCGFFRRGDCYDCFANRAELKEAIAAIEARRAPQ